MLHYRIGDREVRRRLLASLLPPGSALPEEPVEAVVPVESEAVPVTLEAPGEPVPPPVDPELVRALREAFEQGLGHLRQEVETALLELRTECLELAFAAAETITRREVDRGAYGLEDVLREVVDEHRALLLDRPCELRLHPDDAARLDAAEVFRDLGIELVQRSDPALALGTLELRTGATVVVRDVTGELRALRHHLERARGIRP